MAKTNKIVPMPSGFSTPAAVTAAFRKADVARAQAEAEPKKLSEIVAIAVKDALAGLFTQFTDDLYNAAMIQNPAAVAMTQKRTGATQVADETAFRVHTNDQQVPVLVIVRADGPDVVEVAAANSDMAATEAQVRQPAQVSVLLRPNESVWVSCRASDPTAYPVNVVYTVVPLRGRAVVFGG